MYSSPAPRATLAAHAISIRLTMTFPNTGVYGMSWSHFPFQNMHHNTTYAVCSPYSLDFKCQKALSRAIWSAWTSACVAFIYTAWRWQYLHQLLSNIQYQWLFKSVQGIINQQYSLQCCQLLQYLTCTQDPSPAITFYEELTLQL